MSRPLICRVDFVLSHVLAAIEPTFFHNGAIHLLASLHQALAQFIELLPGLIRPQGLRVRRHVYQFLVGAAIDACLAVAYQGFEVYAAFLPLGRICHKGIDGYTSGHENPPDDTFAHQGLDLFGDVFFAVAAGGGEIGQRNGVPGAVPAVGAAPQENTDVLLGAVEFDQRQGLQELVADAGVWSFRSNQVVDPGHYSTPLVR